MVVVRDGHKYKTHREQTAGLVETKTSGLRRGQHKLNLELRYLRLKGV